MVTLNDLKAKTQKANDITPNRNDEVSVHEGREWVAEPPVEQQYAPPDREVAPRHPGTGELADLISSYSSRAKIHGVVMQFQIRGSSDPMEFIAALRRIDPGAEFETEIRKEFGQRGDLKRGVLQMVTIESRGDKVTVVAIGPNTEGHQIRADAWLDAPKAVELIAMLQLSDAETATAQRALDGKEPGVLMMANRGIEFSYREFEKDGKTSRRLAEFHTGAGGGNGIQTNNS
jgi:hypothetical protein